MNEPTSTGLDPVGVTIESVPSPQHLNYEPLRVDLTSISEKQDIEKLFVLVSVWINRAMADAREQGAEAFSFQYKNQYNAGDNPDLDIGAFHLIAYRGLDGKRVDALYEAQNEALLKFVP